MADKQTARLCYQIVLTHFGPVAAKLADALLSRGRLPFSHLARFTRLPLRQARLVVIILIQHNIIWHSENEAEGEVLEINWEEALARMRFGRYVTISCSVLGDRSAEIISTVLDHGKLRVKEVLDIVTGGDIKKRHLYSSNFHSLVESKHLRPSTAISHKSPRDRFLQYEEEGKRERRAGAKGSILMPKDLLEIRMNAASRMQREEEEAASIGLIKKRLDAPDGKGKRKRAVVEETEETAVNEEVYFKVNYPKLNIYIRNQIIVDAAASRFNIQTAEVLRAALKATESKQQNLMDVRSDPVTSHLISIHLNPEIPLDHGLRAPSKSSKRSQPSSIKDYLSKLSCEDNTTPEGAASAFMAGGTGGGKMTVEFDVIGRRLKVRVFESVVRERFGDEAVRVVRILLDKGKMDEKLLAKVALMAHGQLRPLLTRLSTASLVSLQEVPKSADRNPARTFYLWYVDLPKAYSNLLSSLYQTLANIVAREQDEEEKVRPVLEKRDRSDVAGDERLLGRGEIAILREWEEKQERLEVLALRVEEAVFILRDMIGDT